MPIFSFMQKSTYVKKALAEGTLLKTDIREVSALFFSSSLSSLR